MEAGDVADCAAVKSRPEIAPYPGNARTADGDTTEIGYAMVVGASWKLLRCGPGRPLWRRVRVACPACFVVGSTPGHAAHLTSDPSCPALMDGIARLREGYDAADFDDGPIQGRLVRGNSVGAVSSIQHRLFRSAPPMTGDSNTCARTFHNRVHRFGLQSDDKTLAKIYARCPRQQHEPAATRTKWRRAKPQTTTPARLLSRG